MSEVESWLAEAPKLANGKVDVMLLVKEGRRRGYCICPKPMRQMIDFSQEGNPGMPSPMTCTNCLQPEMRASWEFWYGQ